SLAIVETLPDNAASKVFVLFNDSSFIVRQQAEDTFVALAAKCDVAALLEEGLGSSAEKLTRYHSLHIARRIGCSDGVPAVAPVASLPSQSGIHIDAKAFAKRIATELSQTDSPEIAAASLDALAFLAEKGEYAQVIIPFAGSKSQLVRQMAARAMGRLQLPGSENALIGLLEKEKSNDVRAEACEAMGRFPQPVFVPKLVARLKAVRNGTAEERAAAAWALGQTKSNDMKQLVPAAKRLHLHCTKAVIPDVVPMFDDNSVIANAFWTLATLTKRTGNPEIRKCYEDVMRIYGISLEELQKLNASTTETSDYPRSEMTCCMMMQVRQFFDGKEYTTMPVPTQELMLPVKSLK
ncbi:MAG: HEAT repeat domain-containing protein, partial [Victivallales bacterium]|nr:HEAT repeat domain-containing protein [Victivallales bacterium]